MDVDDFGLDMKAVKARLLPGFRRGDQLPTGWVSWKQPHPALPVDKFISVFAKRTRAPRLRAAACPYAIARRGVYQATHYADLRKTLNADRALITAALLGFRESVGPAHEHLTTLVRQLQQVMDTQQACFDDEEEIAQLPLLQDHDRFLAAVSALERLDHAVTEIYQRRAQRVGNVWRIAFAKSMFACWWRLTGCDPSPTGPFCDFLDAALSSLTNRDLQPVTWERTIKTAKSQLQREHGASATPWRIDFAPAE